MLKKFLIWGSYLLFVLLLLAGALYRTAVKWEEKETPLRGNGNHAAEVFTPLADAALPALAVASATPTPFLPPIQLPAAQALTVLIGQVERLTNGGAVVRVDASRSINLTGRAWRFAQEQGFQAQVGDMLSLQGLEGEEKFEIAILTNLRTGSLVTLRDATGHPLWEEGE